jgi:ABC-2 type transport system ATP-binding protein
MAQRVKLAQAIVHGPKLILLDEPASGLDPDGRVQMLDLIRRLGSFGINVIVSSHVLSDIESTCDFVVMLDAGRLVRSGPVTGAHRTSTVSVQILGPVDRFTTSLGESGVEFTVDRNTVAVIGDTDDVFDLIRDAAAASHVGIMRLERRAFTLEDEFLGRADV